MVLFRAMTRSSVAVFLLSVAWSFLCMKDASAFNVPEPRIFDTFFSSFSNCSLAMSCGSFMRLRCTARTRIGFSRRSPCKVVSDGLEKEGRKKDASNDRAAMFALLLCFVKAGFVKVLVVPQSSVIMVARAAALASWEAFRTAACLVVSSRGVRRGESGRALEMAAPGGFKLGAAHRCAPSPRGPRGLGRPWTS